MKRPDQKTIRTTEEVAQARKWVIKRFNLIIII